MHRAFCRRKSSSVTQLDIYQAHMALQGVALKTRTDSVLQHDIRKSDVVFQYTTVSPPSERTRVQDHAQIADC